MTLNEKPNQIYPVAEPKEFSHTLLITFIASVSSHFLRSMLGAVSIWQLVNADVSTYNLKANTRMKFNFALPSGNLKRIHRIGFLVTDKEKLPDLVLSVPIHTEMTKDLP